MNETRPRWYAVLTRPQMEAKAAYYLSRQNYWTFYPFERVVRFLNRPGGKRLRKEIDRPFFSRYIFVCLRRPTESLYDVNETYGVSTVVNINGEPLEIPSQVIDDLMSRTDDRGLVRRAKPLHWFTGKVGDKVQLVDEAPFYGLVVELASLDALDRKDEIGAWIDFLGSRRQVPIPVQSVARIIAA